MRCILSMQKLLHLLRQVWEQGNRQEFNYSRDTQGLLLSMALPGFLLSWPSTRIVKCLKQAAAGGKRHFSRHVQSSSSLRQTFPAIRQEAHCPCRILFLMRTSHTLGEGQPFPRCGPGVGVENRERNHPWLRLPPTAPLRPPPPLS